MTTFAAAVSRRESSVVRLVRRGVIAVACLYMVSFWWSMCRRIWQVLRIETHASSLVLAPGSTVGYDVVTSGEAGNRITLELIQGAQREVLLEQRARVHRVRSIDPRCSRSELGGRLGGRRRCNVITFQPCAAFIPSLSSA
jgi:hypothetical protein